MSWGPPCAGGIWLGGGGKDGGDDGVGLLLRMQPEPVTGGAGGRVPVGFGSL